jgi:glycosyltransferase involved in cell wall biosynthesis
MSLPLVTIGISCWNCARYLPLLVESIRQQSYPNWEVVAIDDGSTDDTRAALKAINDPRFRVVLSDDNRGLSRRLNEIADLATGEFLARTDADDLMMPLRIERQVQAFLRDPSLDVVSSRCLVVDNRNRLRGLRRMGELPRSAREVMLRNGPSHPTVMTRTSWARTNRYRCVHRRGEDLDLWIRTIEHSRFLQLPEALQVIREDRRFDAGKYQRTIREHRRVVRNYLPLPDAPGFGATVQSVMLARALGYRVLGALGLADHFAARRNLPTAREDASRLHELLLRIQSNTAG